MRTAAKLLLSWVMVAGIAATVCVPLTAAPVDQVRYALCDVRVLYLFNSPEDIDWPTLYYLNDEFGCRIDLLTLRHRTTFDRTLVEIPEREIYSFRYFVPEDESALDMVADNLFADRRPDIVIFGAGESDSLSSAFRDYLRELTPAGNRLFDIVKIYAHAEPGDTVKGSRRVVLNRRELSARYRERIEREVPRLFSSAALPEYTSLRLQEYRLLASRVDEETPEATFLSGLDPLRLPSILERTFADGPKREVQLTLANEFVSSFRAAEAARGRDRAELIVRGFKRLSDLIPAPNDTDIRADYRAYLQTLAKRAERATLAAIGIKWDGDIIVRDSPHGPKVKYRLSVSADGPRPVELSAITFHPYWDGPYSLLDSLTHTVAPHQTYLREYLVDIDRERLEAQQPESLTFTAQVQYGALPLDIRSTLPIWEAPELGVRFEPPFYFVPPPPELDVDRVVSTMNWRVIITKPASFAGTVEVALQTPRGLFAGAYRQTIDLEHGKTREVVRIPFSISNLFELGIQQQHVALKVDGRTVVADTAMVRIASCHIDERVNVGFLSDTSGHLEDILRMTDADFEPLTDRTLLTGDLESYDVLVIGSGAYNYYPSLRKVKDRLENYLRYGGSVVIMGQTEEWPEGVLPISYVPGVELLDQEAITESIPGARVLSTPYRITVKGLLSYFYRKRDVHVPIVAPAERVFVTPTGATLLSVSRFGEGQIICIGFPLLEMIGRLDIEAIHLFANILNY